MCKHFSIIPYKDLSDVGKSINTLLTIGLVKSAVNGNNNHGTGVGWITDDGEIKVTKSGTNAAEYTHTGEYFNLMDNLPHDRPIIGHVRRASVNIQNRNKSYPVEDAHPFAINNTLLAHNGTITNHTQLVNKYNLESGRIDSHVVAEMFSKLDDWSLDSLNSVTKQLHGSFALVMQHVDEVDKVYVCRHKKELYTGNVDNKFRFIVTDESIAKSAIILADQMSRILLGSYPFTEWNFELLDENVWYVCNNKVIEALGELKYHIPPPAPVKAKNRTHFDNTGYYSKGIKGENREIIEHLASLIETCNFAPRELRILYNELFDDNKGYRLGDILYFVGFIVHLLKENRGILERMLEVKIEKIVGEDKYTVKRIKQ